MTTGQLPLPLSERDKTDVLLALLAHRHIDKLDWLRRQVRAHYQQHMVPLTTDDCRPLIEAMERAGMSDPTNRNWAGCIFRGAGWRCVGFTHSRLPGSHANLLRQWVYEGGG